MPKMIFERNDTPPSPRPRPIRRAALVIATGLLLAPPIHDATALCVARWRAMAGQDAVAETPVLDALGDGSEAIAAEFRRSTSWLIHDPPWRPTLTLSLAFAWVAAATWLLRRA